jgi:dimethylamine/trimethylamine dehydrogenase
VAGGVTAAHVYDAEGHERTWDADATVLVTQRRSNEGLFRELKDAAGLDALKAEGVEALYRIGDCEAPRLIADAVFSGHRLAREIDTDNPAVPLPFKRERRVPDATSLEHDLEELRARRKREAVPA